MGSSNAFDVLILPISESLGVILAFLIFLKLAQRIIDWICDECQSQGFNEPCRSTHRRKRRIHLLR